MESSSLLSPVHIQPYQTSFQYWYRCVLLHWCCLHTAGYMIQWKRERQRRCFRVVSPKCAATMQNMSPPYALGDVKLFDPLSRATLSSFLLHFLKGHGSFGPFLSDFTPPPETKRREPLWCSAARCSPLLPQAVIAAALTVQLPSPASYCVTLLFVRPPPRWFIGHTGEALLDPRRGVCAYVCVCVLCTRAFGKLGVAGIHPQPLPLSLHLIVRHLCSDWQRSSHSKRGNVRHCCSICSAAHCPTCLLLWKEKIQLWKTQWGKRSCRNILRYSCSRSFGTFGVFFLLFKELNP